jgi:hypothetical protein
MSEALQDLGVTYSEEVETPEVEEQVIEDQPEESGAELAPASPEEGEQNTEDSEKQALSEGAQKAINKQHFKYREEQRKRLELEERLKELESKQEVSTAPGEIPPIPDSWDENYEQKIRQREEAIQRKAAFDAQEQLRADQAAITQREQQRQELERSQKLQEQFSANANKLGVNPESLQKAQEVVVSYGITPDLATALIEDSDGPLMVQHLAANPLELDALIHAPPISAGLKLAEIKAKASALKPKPSSAPTPPTTLKGRGAPEKQRGPEGATFE